MRVSADPDDAGFINFHGDHVVYLDNRLVNDCVTADEDLGFVEVFERDKDNRFIACGNKVQTCKKFGVVVIK